MFLDNFCRMLLTAAQLTMSVRRTRLSEPESVEESMHQQVKLQTVNAISLLL